MLCCLYVFLFRQTLSVLEHAKQIVPSLVTKSSIMLGLGESDEEVLQTMTGIQRKADN